MVLEPGDATVAAHDPAAMLAAAGLGRRLGSRWIWRGIDVRLTAGERAAIAGPSGSGKTLLLRCLAGLDPFDEGWVRLEGRLQEEWPPPAYRSRVVYLHQRAALWDGSVEDNLGRVFRLESHADRTFDRGRVLRWLAAFGRDERFLTQHADALSGGEAQIAALVRALQIDPDVLLLDEPTASMDAAATRAAEDLLGDWISAGPRRCYLWSSHDDAQLDRVATRRMALR